MSTPVTPVANAPGSAATAARDRVFLIGYRGTGKTTVAQLLAEALGWQWCDADEVLEQRYGRTIRAICTDEGESGFRDKEAAVLEELCQRRACVIATGGGVVLRPENRERICSAGYVVWLTADRQTTWERLQRDPATPERRPPLAIGGLEEVEESLRARASLYRLCAHLMVDTSGRSPRDVADDILRSLSVSEPRPLGSGAPC